MDKDNLPLSISELENVSGGLDINRASQDEYATEPCPKCGGVGKKLIKRFGKNVTGGQFVCDTCGNKFN